MSRVRHGHARVGHATHCYKNTGSKLPVAPGSAGYATLADTSTYLPTNDDGNTEPSLTSSVRAG